VGVIAVLVWFYDFAVVFTGASRAQAFYLLFASFAVLGQLVVGYASDKLDRFGMASLGMLLFGLAALAFIVARTYVVFLLLAPVLALGPLPLSAVTFIVFNSEKDFRLTGSGSANGTFVTEPVLRNPCEM
jgi:sugar phosphate permease